MFLLLIKGQLDDRYFQDLKGQYEFTLRFTLRSLESHKTICQVQPVHQFDRRSVNCEVDLKPGLYELIPNITAERDDDSAPVEEMVRIAVGSNPSKLREVGKRYDLAHAKVGATTPSGLGGTRAGYNPQPESETRSSIESDSGTEYNTGSSERQQWNAVCIVGLRVLARHAGISITDSGDLG